MGTKEVQGGGGELPPVRRMKPITEIDVFGVGRCRVVEGLGSNRDIVALGNRALEFSDFYGGVNLHGGVRLFSTSSVGHGDCALLAEVYINNKTGEYLPFERLYKDTVRINFEHEGSETVAVIDGRQGGQQAEKAAQVLTDLGFNKHNIRYRPEDFKEKGRLGGSL